MTGRGRAVKKEEIEKHKERELEKGEDKQLEKRYGGKKKVDSKRKRKRSSSSSGLDRDYNPGLKTQVQMLTEKIKDMEGSRK